MPIEAQLSTMSASGLVHLHQQSPRDNCGDDVEDEQLKAHPIRTLVVCVFVEDCCRLTKLSYGIGRHLRGDDLLDVIKSILSVLVESKMNFPILRDAYPNGARHR